MLDKYIGEGPPVQVANDTNENRFTGISQLNENITNNGNIKRNFICNQITD